MITSASNAQIKHVINLLNKAKYRREQKAFVVEGIRMVQETPSDRLEKIYVSESYIKEHKSVAGMKEGSPKLEVVSDSVFKQMSDTKTPQGVLAVVRIMQYALADVIGKEDALVLVCEDIQDPGNLGTILRTGEGAGVSGVIMTTNTVDIYNPKTIRSTMGSLYRVPFVVVENLSETIKQMQLLGIKVYAAHLNGNNSYVEEDYTGKSAFLIGNEGNGLKEETAAMADTLIRIPMEGSVESLNAAISSAILMYEAHRQRNHST